MLLCCSLISCRNDAASPAATGDAVPNAISTDVREGIDDTTHGGITFPIHLGDAENLLFTDTGRIFATGANVAELTADGPVLLFPENYGAFAGIAQVGPWLYVVCAKYRTPIPPLDCADLLKAKSIMDLLVYFSDDLMDKVLLRADLRAGSADRMVFTTVHHFTDMLIPNGMAADTRGNLYVADETFLPQGKIVKIVITGDDPPMATQTTWLSYTDGVYSPNGMCIRDDVLYFTDFNINALKMAQVKKVAIQADKPGPVETVYAGSGLYDDLDVRSDSTKTTIAVASFLSGSILLIDEQTGGTQTIGKASLQCPSSVHFGSGALIAEDELIVTEVGMLYEPYSNFGNRIRLLTVP